MGYCSTISLDICIDQLDAFKGFMAEIKMRIASEIAEDWEYEIAELDLEEDFLVCEDCFAKWYYDLAWIPRIALYAEDGEIEFTGEDGENWGYFIENHEAYVMEYHKFKGEKLDIPESHK
jgi:hypothetical protein